MTNWERKFTMPTWKSMLLAGTIALTPIAVAPLNAAAQEAPVAEIVADDSQAEFGSEAYAAEAKAKMQREMDEAIAVLETIFGTDDLTPVDPARLTLARTTTAALIPPGSLEKMMDNMYGRMFGKLMETLGATSDLSLSIKTGVEGDTIAALDDPTKDAIADMFDPHRKDRDDQILKVVRPLISEVLADMEPPMREGLAKAYARKFSSDQLTQLNGFFASPIGSLYASESMALQADPEVMLALIKAVPPLVTKFIDRAPTIEKDMKELPKEKALTDFSDTELNRLAKLMKVDVKVLKDHRDTWSSEAIDAVDAGAAEMAADDYAADADAAAVDAAVAATDDPAYDRSTWSDADRQRVEDLEAASGSAAIAAAEAQEEAAANARNRAQPPSD